MLNTKKDIINELNSIIISDEISLSPIQLETVLKTFSIFKSIRDNNNLTMSDEWISYEEYISVKTDTKY